MERPYAQSFEKHARIIPTYHGLTFGIFAVNLLWSLYRTATAFSWESLLSLLLAVAFIFLFFHARLMAITVQDRVIRLEMRLRLERLLPDDLGGRIGEFSVEQLVGMRFASDAELPDLARRVLEERLADRKAIKRLVKDWQGDFLRV
jgi:hypothetical protein